MATQSYEDMANCLFEGNWQKLSVRLQTFLIPMIENAQRPIYYHGFGVAVLNLETFMRVRMLHPAWQMQSFDLFNSIPSYSYSEPLSHIIWHLRVLRNNSNVMK